MKEEVLSLHVVVVIVFLNVLFSTSLDSSTPLQLSLFLPLFSNILDPDPNLDLER